MEVALTLKFQYKLSWLGGDADVDRALFALYHTQIGRLVSKGMRIIDFVFEKDSEGLLHVHAHARLNKKLYNPGCQAWKDRYDTFGCKGFATKIDHASNLPGWKKYMLKDANSPRYFYQGKWLSPNAEREAVQLAGEVYDRCIRNEIAILERMLQEFKN